MKNLFIPYKLAVMAKEKGFDEPCFACHIGTNDFTISVAYSNSELVGSNYTAAPLYQQIVDWFREKHMIIIGNPSKLMGGYFMSTVSLVDQLPQSKPNSQEYYKCFNKALEEAFKLI